MHNDWLPAVERFGEGLFLRFGATVLASWLGRDATLKRLAVLRHGATRWAHETQRARRSRKAVILRALNNS
jgi:hypothetical protein